MSPNSEEAPHLTTAAGPDRSPRIAGAPISWGVCEVPDWGHQMDPGRVLTEMSELGLTATEFGPDGFLPADPRTRAGLLDRYGLSAVGGFMPLVLHQADQDPLPLLDAALPGFLASRAGTVVLAAATGVDGYDSRPEPDERMWRTLLGNLDRIAAWARDAGLTVTLHPHVGTMVETEADVHRVLDGSEITLCLDTGHLLIGGTDPVALARGSAARISHVHLKDVDAERADAVRTGRLAYSTAVRDGMYRPLGAGDIDIPAILGALANVGYVGWYVLEQDTMLPAAPEPGSGPAGEVRDSLTYLRKVTT